MARTGAIEFAELRGESVWIRTTPCVVCCKQHTFLLNNNSYVAWQYGEDIQNVFPELSDGDRETLISGTCSDCFDTLFKEENDD